MAKGSVHTRPTGGPGRNKVEAPKPLSGVDEKKADAIKVGRTVGPMGGIVEAALRREPPHALMRVPGPGVFVPYAPTRKRRRVGENAVQWSTEADKPADSSDGVDPLNDTYTRGAWVAAVFSAAVRGGRRVNAELVKEAEFGWYSQQFAQQWRNEARRHQRVTALNYQRDFGPFGPSSHSSRTAVTYLAIAAISVLAGVLIVIVTGG